MDGERLDIFVRALIAELKWRYDACEDGAATPSSILLATLNAVTEARNVANMGPSYKPRARKKRAAPR